MRFEIIALFAAAATTSAQSVVGKAYGYGAGATGGGSAAAVKPANTAELAKLLADDVARTIVLDKTFDFTGQTATGSGCVKKTCTPSGGGQYFLGTVSCSAQQNAGEMSSVNGIKYDKAGLTALPVGSNKSILGVGGKGVIKGKGLSLKKGASNVIIQGVELSTINPSVVWGGDALDLQGGNTKIWVDHCKFSTTGRMFIVSHYDGSSLTLSNNEFDGVTSTSATCNKNHYWTIMFIGKNEKITIDKNYFHDVSGRAPKLGQDGVSGMFHAVNNLFENMKGHAFDAYTGANALVEGNAFVAVAQPNTQHAASIATFVTKGGNACSSSFGRACLENSVDSASGPLAPGSSTGFISKFGKTDVLQPMAANKVAAYVKANAGPSKLGAKSARSANTSMKVAVAGAHPAFQPGMVSPNDTAIAQAPGVAMPTGAVQVPGAAMPTGAPGGAVGLYRQCGGAGHTGPTECEAGASCVKANEFYSQCIHNSSKFRRVIRD